MKPMTRFVSPLSGFKPEDLLYPLRATFCVSFILGSLIHLGLVAIDPFEEQARKAPKPLTTKFVKREPRLTKPLELRKIPQPKRQMVKREMHLAAARMDQVQATASFNTKAVIGNVSTPTVALFPGLARRMSRDVKTLEMVPPVLTGTRSSENKIDMALELMDVNSMNTGRYRAIIIEDPTDRQNITGFIRFAHVQSARSIEFGRGGIGSRAIDAVRDALNEFTGIGADYEGYLTFDDSRMMEIPIIFSSGGANESESEALSRYLLAGGFVFGGIPFEGLEKYGGLVVGRDIWKQRLPDDHPIYSSFFDIKGGAPAYDQGGWSGKQGIHSWSKNEGYYVKGRLAGITFGWGVGLGFIDELERTRNHQLVVNTMVYALTQEGSMTKRLMQMVN